MKFLSYLTIFLLIVNIAGCAIILYEYPGVIIGRVRLSDNPSSGHGGVTVKTDTESTKTSNNGEFSLEGSIVRKGTIVLYFEKSGYKTESKELEFDDFEYSEEENTSICDLGEIVLNRG